MTYEQALKAEIIRRDVRLGDGEAWLAEYRGQHFVVSAGQWKDNPPEHQVFRSDASGKVTGWDEVASGDSKASALLALTARPVDEDGRVLSARDVQDAAEAAEDVPEGRTTHIVKRESGYVAGWFQGEPPAGFVDECNANVPSDPAHAEKLDYTPLAQLGREHIHSHCWNDFCIAGPHPEDNHHVDATGRTWDQAPGTVYCPEHRGYHAPDGCEITATSPVATIYERDQHGTCEDCGCPEQAGEMTTCSRCGAHINTAYGADSPAEHAGAAGTRDDPRSPGDHDDICDVCNYS